MQSNIKKHKHLYGLFISICVLILSTGTSIALDFLGIKELNIIMIYLIGILLITIETNGYRWGIFSCFISIALFNFFFTQPRYSFMVNDPNYFFTFILFLVVAFIISTLVSRLQKHASISSYNEKQTHLLYEVSLGYLNISGLSNILNYGITSLNRLQLFPAIVYPAVTPTELSSPCYPDDMDFYTDLPENNTIALWCLTNIVPCGFGTSYFNHSAWKYIPMKRENKIFGVAAFFCNGKKIDDKDMLFIDTIISQMALALEREELASQRSTLRVEREKEQLKDNILRSLSHDLRTPLTNIVGSSSLMLDSFDKLDKDRMLHLLDGINTDANWLMMLTENLLSTSRIQDGKLQLNIQEEVVDDLIYDATRHMEKFLAKHQLNINVPAEVMTVPVDSHLIVQVLVNLIDNAIKHTEENCTIDVSAYQENNYLVFEVSDNGGGIDANSLDSIFLGFMSNESQSPDSHRGIGLGLPICKSIVEAHNGRIMAFNNNSAGATFKVMLLFNQH